MGNNHNELVPNSEFVRRSRAKCLASVVRLNTLSVPRLPSQCNEERRSPHKTTEAEKTSLLFSWPIKERRNPWECSGCDPDEAKQRHHCLWGTGSLGFARTKPCQSDSIKLRPIPATVPARWRRRKSAEVFILSHAVAGCTNFTFSRPASVSWAIGGRLDVF